MNDLQKKEFDLLKHFIRICKELDLTYFLVCGSALGAVKYQGFIPWDDDIDVALPRKDYETFVEHAQSLLPEYIFLQNYKTDKLFPHIFSKLRNSNTTYIEKAVSNISINHGVYIDVFPLDGYPVSEKEANKLEVKKRNYLRRCSCIYNLSQVSIKSKIAYRIRRLLGFHKNLQKHISKLEKVFSSYSIEDSLLICNHGNWQGKLEYASREQYGEGSWAVFEGMKVRIPEKYDEYLTQKYGNWRADIPENEKQGHHFYSVCDLEHPYTDYVHSKCKKNNKAVHLFGL